MPPCGVKLFLDGDLNNRETWLTAPYHVTEDTGNNRRLASEIVTIAEATLYQKIKKYGL